MLVTLLAKHKKIEGLCGKQQPPIIYVWNTCDSIFMIKTLTNFDATGHYVPQLAEVVYEHNKHLEANQQIHLKGFIVSD